MTISAVIRGATVLTMARPGPTANATITIAGELIDGVYPRAEEPEEVRAWLVGVIAAGKSADLVVLAEDPLADLTACDDAVELVVRAGRVVRPQSLLEACAGGDIV